MSLEGERVMLLGGAGFIGHHLALELKRKKAEVLIVDGLHVNNIGRIVSDPDLNEARRSLYLNFLLERFELLREAGIPINNSDARLMNEVMRVYLDFMPTKVVHLSAISSAVTAEKDQTFAYDLQITTLRNILDIISSPVSVTTQIMFMSSSTVYGDFESDTVDETVRPKPKGVYANGKFICERMLRHLSREEICNFTIIRPSALYGVRCINSRVSQVFIENALMGKPLYLEGGGEGRLDFTHIDDLIQGMVRALVSPEALSRTFNLTRGNARLISELASIVKAFVPGVIIEERPPAPHKPKRGTLNIDRARECLGFNPTIDLEQGYSRFCQWYVEQWARVHKG